jgi:hypothetical protein
VRLGSALLLAGLAVAVAAGSCASEDGESKARAESAQCLSKAGTLYEQKLAPLLATDRPKTCNQCHLSGVDLGLFVRDDMCETRACLVELGLVDLENPADSPVLGWIARAHPDSELITQEVIDDEYAAFQAFVEQIAKCGGQACPGVHCPATHGDDACGFAGDEPLEPIVPAMDCAPLQIETAFRDGVYVWRDRCYPCHFASEKGVVPGAPLWIDTLNSCNAGSLATFHNVIERGLIDLDDPTQSLLLLKPLDAAEGGVAHGGGPKFAGVDDPSYRSFLAFIEYWIGCGAPVP